MKNAVRNKYKANHKQLTYKCWRLPMRRYSCTFPRPQNYEYIIFVWSWLHTFQSHILWWLFQIEFVLVVCNSQSNNILPFLNLKIWDLQSKIFWLIFAVDYALRASTAGFQYLTVTIVSMRSYLSGFSYWNILDIFLNKVLRGTEDPWIVEEGFRIDLKHIITSNY